MYILVILILNTDWITARKRKSLSQSDGLGQYFKGRFMQSGFIWNVWIVEVDRQYVSKYNVYK